MNIVLRYPPFIATAGLADIIVSLLLILIFTIIEPTPHFVFYLTFSVLCFLGIVLMLKGKNTCLVVTETALESCSMWGKKRSVLFSEIVQVKRQVKNNRVHSERLLLTAANGGRIVAEKGQTSYFAFRYLLMKKLDKEKLVGFESLL